MDLMYTDYENNGQNLLVLKFRPTVGMCEICKSADTRLSPHLSLVYVHYEVIICVNCVYALVLFVQYCISVVETL
jgi:hypothetical protein